MPSAILAVDAAGHSAAFLREIEAHGGRVANMSGDSMLAVFETASGALGAALAAQHGLESAQASNVRIGAHLGGADIAMRLRANAHAGAICISQQLYEAVRDKMVFQAQPGGTHCFRNIREPVTLWHVADVNAELHLPQAAPVAGTGHSPHRFLPFAVIAGMILGGAFAWWWISHSSKEHAHISQAASQAARTLD